VVESEILTEDEAPVVVATINKKQRALNTIMTGEVRMGKYSKQVTKNEVKQVVVRNI
jgi:hypothetical protein